VLLPGDEKYKILQLAGADTRRLTLVPRAVYLWAKWKVLFTGPSLKSYSLLGTAESDFHQAHARYATFEELVRSGRLSGSAAKSAQNLHAFHSLDIRVGYEPLAGFSLDLMVASDGATYKLSLTAKSHTCKPGWFTDNTGTLYEGKPVDCEVASSEEPRLLDPINSKGRN
jgi:hypothetical protein